jgi:hypothetical protein
LISVVSTQIITWRHGDIIHEKGGEVKKGKKVKERRIQGFGGET